MTYYDFCVRFEHDFLIEELQIVGKKTKCIIFFGKCSIKRLIEFVEEIYNFYDDPTFPGCKVIDWWIGVTHGNQSI